MYDMCLCYGKDCPWKGNCYRFTAEYFGRQNFFGSPPFREDKCEHFLDNAHQIQKLAYHLWLSEGKQEGKDDQYWQAAKVKLLLAHN